MSLSPMVVMSRAIRHVLEDYEEPGIEAGLKSLPDDALLQFVQIVGAFYGDLKAEVDRRQAT